MTEAYRISNLLPRITGLKYPIWYRARIENQEPIIKVDLEDGKNIYVSIEERRAAGDIDSISPEDLNDIYRWIELNKELLLKYWNGADKGIIDCCDVAELMVNLESGEPL